MRHDRITFATTNKDKLRETQIILGVPVHSISLDVFEIQTLDPIVCVEAKAELALAKARTEGIQAILVDDTTFYLSALNNQLPGVFTDYFIQAIGLEGILGLIKGKDDRGAIAQTCLCYYDGHKKITVSGIVEGRVPPRPHGDRNFGWDPIFIPNGHYLTFGQMDPEFKNQISPRRFALEELKLKLPTPA